MFDKSLKFYREIWVVQVDKKDPGFKQKDKSNK
jgi:hypothetical protein